VNEEGKYAIRISNPLAGLSLSEQIEYCEERAGRRYGTETKISYLVKAINIRMKKIISDHCE